MRAESAEASDVDHDRDRDADSSGEHRARDVAGSFFWQTPGAIVPYAISAALLLMFGAESGGVGKDHRGSTLVQYVLLVGLGAAPCAVVLVSTWRKAASDSRGRGQHMTVGGDDNDNNHDGGSASGTSGRRSAARLSAALHDGSHLRVLLGTRLSWALYDFVYYGTAFNLPEMLAGVLGEEGGLAASSIREALVTAMGIPGVLCAIWMIEPMGGPKPLQGWGFVLIGSACLLLSLFHESGDAVGPLIRWGGFASCCILIFALNWGCNVSTYVMPIEKFPWDCRSTFHGLSAGMGKIGALVGSAVFTELNAVSIGLTLWACACSCLVGVCVTHFLIPPSGKGTFFGKQNDSGGGSASDGYLLRTDSAPREGRP